VRGDNDMEVNLQGSSCPSREGVFRYEL